MSHKSVGAWGHKGLGRTDNAGMRMTGRGLSVALLLILANWILAAQAAAETSPFYAGKTIRVIVGSTTGTLYNDWAHLLARYMPKHIPGAPKMTVQNMPGASGLVAANYGYTVAAPDGSTLIMFHRHVYIEQLIERKEAKFDVSRFRWIGSPDKSLPILYIRADSPYRSIDDILKAADPPKCGAIGTSDLTYSMSKVMEVALDTRVNLVVGYPSGKKIDAAMERGEVICRVASLDVHFHAQSLDAWHKRGFDRHLLLFGRHRHPRIPNVPTIYELMERRKTPDLSRRIVEVSLAGNELGRPMVAPPGTPGEAVSGPRI